ncbi:MAG: hypothetical protein K0V04_00480 [Deltaproteobacteria bacterium]|nr:hypothetical protein [Deltaproteobacteria bacterium]
MDDGLAFRIALALRMDLALATGLVVSGCGESPQSCPEEGSDCLPDTTTSGSTTAAPSPGASGDGQFDEPIMRVECFGLPPDGSECPVADSQCVEDKVDARDDVPSCGCFSGYQLSEILDGPDPDISDACCYTARLQYTECFVGRPFVVAGQIQVAPNRARADWRDSSSSPRDPRARAALDGRAWLAMAQMEHASVAAFARMTLVLLALGAPSQLVHDTAAAMQDEIAHACACYGIASDALGQPVGPGPLPTHDAMSGGTAVETVVLDLVEEGCRGETVAAAHALAASARAPTPFIAQTLRTIADDESRHAALAFRTLAWLCGDPTHGPRARLALAEALAALETPSSTSDGPAPGALDHLGVDVERLTGVIEAQTVRPLLRSLLEQRDAAG